MPPLFNKPAAPTVEDGKARSYIVAARTTPFAKTGLIEVTRVTVEVDHMSAEDSMRIDLADDPLYKDLQGYVLSNPR